MFLAHAKNLNVKKNTVNVYNQVKLFYFQDKNAILTVDARIVAMEVVSNMILYKKKPKTIDYKLLYFIKSLTIIYFFN